MTEDSLACRDARELDDSLALSKSPPSDLPSSLAFLLSFLLLREKKDLPPEEDCRDFAASVADMTGTKGRGSGWHVSICRDQLGPPPALQLGCGCVCIMRQPSASTM
jgi:hypothetical protein